MDLIYWSVHSSSRRGGDNILGVDGGYRYFSQLRLSLYRKICFNIQVIIYLLYAFRFRNKNDKVHLQWRRLFKLLGITLLSNVMFYILKVSFKRTYLYCEMFLVSNISRNLLNLKAVSGQTTEPSYYDLTRHFMNCRHTE